MGKGGADGRAFCAVADVAGVGALAEDEAEGINEDAFSRAGFAGEDVVAGRKRMSLWAMMAIWSMVSCSSMGYPWLSSGAMPQLSLARRRSWK